MFIDLSDLESTPTKKVRLMRLCGACKCVLPSYHSACPACESTAPLLPYLDRRPLLLDRDTRNSILDLIDEGAARLTDEVLTDEQNYLANEYLPFLSLVLKESETAERLVSMENHRAYRKTNETKEQIIAHLRDMILPSTVESA